MPMAALSPGSFLNLDGRKYMVQDDGASWSLAMPDASTLRFEVREGDHIASDPFSKNRSEVAMQGVIKDGTPISLAYGLTIEPGAFNSASFCLVGQFHPAQGTAVSYLGPPFSIGLSGERMTVNVGYTNAAGVSVTRPIFIDTANIVRGHDYGIKVQLRLDPYGGGRLIVTRDGLTLVNYTGPLGWKGEGGVYWKEGIYRATAPETLAVDFKGLSLGTGAPTALGRSGPILQSFTQYDSAGHKTTSVTVYTNGSTTTDHYNVSGALVESRVVRADGSRIIHDYLVTGASYVADERVYNAAGKLTEFVAVHADGSQAIDNYAISGKPYASDHVVFNASGVLTSAVYHNKDGSTTTETFAATGALLQTSVVYADGWRSVYDFHVAGASYVSDQRVYNAGTLTHFVGYGANGSKLVDNYAVTGKSYVADHLTYNPSGILTTAVYNEHDGSTVTYRYTSAGSLFKCIVVHASGARDVYDYGITGQSYVADHRVYNAGGALTEIVTTAANGSEKLTAFAAGLTLTGTAGNDVFYSHGGDAFVFKGAFGHDAVNYFHAGNLSNHDFIELAASAVPGFTHLHMVQVGSNVVITIDAHDSVTLAHVKLATLTPHDFIFA
jgi:hypothetical protein